MLPPAIRRFGVAFLPLLLGALILQTSAAHADDATLDAPPTGLAPTTVKLSAILLAHEKAVGSLDTTVRNSAVEDWTFTAQGVTGTEHLDRFGTDYRSKITFGPFVDEYGQLGTTRWHRDENGYVSPRSANDELSFTAQRVLADADDPKNDVSVAGVTVDKAPAYVLKVTLEGQKHPEWVYYDVTSGLITRVESVSSKRRDVSTYSDYRKTDGLTTPWSIHDSDGRAEIDREWHRSTLVYGGPANTASYAMPHSNASMSENITQAGYLHVRYTVTGPVVRIDVQGRGLDFLLLPSTPMSVIDRDVARELSLPTFGQPTQLSDGTSLPYNTILDNASAGPMLLQHFALSVQDFSYRPDLGTKVVGVLGYDFLAGNVFRVDDVNGTVEVLPSATFHGTDTIPDSFEMPVTLDNGIPFITMGLGGEASHRVLFAYSSPVTVVFGSFYNAHQDDFKDNCKLGCKHLSATLPFADDDKFGKTFDLWGTEIQQMHLAGYDFQNVPVIATDTDLPVTGGVDAILGGSLLGYFNVYYDYPNSRVVLAKNAYFFRKFKPHAATP